MIGWDDTEVWGRGRLLAEEVVVESWLTEEDIGIEWIKLVSHEEFWPIVETVAVLSEFTSTFCEVMVVTIFSKLTAGIWTLSLLAFSDPESVFKAYKKSNSFKQLGNISYIITFDCDMNRQALERDWTYGIPFVVICYCQPIDIYSSCELPEHEPSDPKHLKMGNCRKRSVSIFAVVLELL